MCTSANILSRLHLQVRVVEATAPPSPIRTIPWCFYTRDSGVQQRLVLVKMHDDPQVSACLGFTV